METLIEYIQQQMFEEKESEQRENHFSFCDDSDYEMLCPKNFRKYFFFFFRYFKLTGKVQVYVVALLLNFFYKIDLWNIFFGLKFIIVTIKYSLNFHKLSS